jgi:hypothetical protein
VVQVEAVAYRRAWDDKAKRGCGFTELALVSVEPAIAVNNMLMDAGLLAKCRARMPSNSR